MTSTPRRISVAAISAAIVTSALLIGGAGVANADESNEWPPVPTEPSPNTPFETKGFLTPTDPDYYNPTIVADRLTSPFGTSTRIVCTGFHGVLTGCWQADANGKPHKLIRVSPPLPYPGSAGALRPGGGPGFFVYPGLIPGLT